MGTLLLCDHSTDTSSHRVSEEDSGEGKDKQRVATVATAKKKENNRDYQKVETRQVLISHGERNPTNPDPSFYFGI